MKKTQVDDIFQLPGFSFVILGIFAEKVSKIASTPINAILKKAIR